jgi:1-acyl-sn-glycerol-3-phosphate acyltransferase
MTPSSTASGPGGPKGWTAPFSWLPGSPGSPTAWRAFELAFRPWLRRQLHAIELRGGTARALIAEPGRDDASPPPPLLLVANHTSWFDGFLLREVHRRIRPAAPLRSLMLSRELDRAPILRWIGGTGFTPERPLSLRGALREIEPLRESGVCVSYFPQGYIYPASRRPLGFHAGIDWVARQLAPCDLLPVGLHLEMTNRTRPTAWIVVGDRIPVGSLPPGGVAHEAEIRVTALLDTLFAHLHTHGEGARTAPWPIRG